MKRLIIALVFSVLIIGIMDQNTHDTCALKISGDNLTIENIYNGTNYKLSNLSMIDVMTHGPFEMHSTIPETDA